MIKRLFLIVWNIFFINILFAQVPNIQWQISSGGSGNDEGNSLCLTFDGGYIISGYSGSANVTNAHGFEDFWIEKLDSAGNLIWNKCFGGSSNEICYSVSPTLDSGFILAGYANHDDADVSGIHGTRDFWVVKLSKLRILEWQKCLGGTEIDEAHSIIQTLDSGFLVVGVTMSLDGDVHGFHGNEDVWVVKLNQVGSIQWSKTLGGTDFEEGNTCLQLANGNYIVAGSAASNDGDVTGVHNSSSDVWVIELDSTGSMIWQKCYGGSGIDNAFKIILANDGGYYVVASTSSSDGDVPGNHGQQDFWLIKTDSLGSMQWEKCFGGVNIERATSVCLASDGGVLMVGHSSLDDGMVFGNHGGSFPYFPDFWAVKADSLGNFEWGKCLGGTGDDIAYDVKQTLDGGYVIAGSSNSNDGDVTGNHGGKDVWVVKLSPPGLSVPEMENTMMDLNLFQNSGELNLRFFSKHYENVKILIYDIDCSKIFEKNISTNEGINYIQINCDGIVMGMYVLTIEGERSSLREKVFIE